MDFDRDLSFIADIDKGMTKETVGAGGSPLQQDPRAQCGRSGGAARRQGPARGGPRWEDVAEHRSIGCNLGSSFHKMLTERKAEDRDLTGRIWPAPPGRQSRSASPGWTPSVMRREETPSFPRFSSEKV